VSGGDFEEGGCSRFPTGSALDGWVDEDCLSAASSAFSWRIFSSLSATEELLVVVDSGLEMGLVVARKSRFI
jgi:hypothetical protein